MTDEGSTKNNSPDAQAIMRMKWRKWSQARRSRMSPEEIAEARKAANERRTKRLATPGGREKQREQGRRWRENNEEKIRISREKQRLKRLEKAAAARQARLSDPEYIRRLEEREAARAVGDREAWRRYYRNRKARLDADPEAKAAYRAKQLQYRLAKKERLFADPVLFAAYLEKQKASAEARKQGARPTLSDQEKADRARRRREERAKAQRLLNAKRRAEREAQKAEELATSRVAKQAEPAKRQPPIRKMGRLTALMKWHGR